MSPILGIWASSFAQPTGDYQAIMTATVDSGGASSITFSSIPSTFKHLQIRAIAKDTGTTYGTGLQAYLRMNSDSGANYSYHFLRGQGSSAAAGGGGTYNQMYLGYYPGSSSNTYGFGVMVIDILDYANTNKNKTARALSGDDLNGSGTIALTSGLWQSTAAISTITITCNDVAFAQNSTFALYGIKGA